MGRSRTGPNGKSVLAGAGTGTGLVGLASLLPDSYGTLKTILTYAAPSASVIVNALWMILSVQIGAWWDKWRINNALREARAECARVHANPYATQEHKANMQSRLEKLEILKLEMLAQNSVPVRNILTSGEPAS